MVNFYMPSHNYDVIFRGSIFSDCKQYLDEDNMLTAPLDIQVADQVRKIDVDKYTF